MTELHIQEVNNPNNVLVIGLFDKPATLGGVSAKWDTVSRPRRSDLIEFSGNPLFQLDVSGLFNEYPNGNIENKILQLENWVKSERNYQPPTLKLYGPIPHPEKMWVLTEISYQKLVDFNSQGKRCRQAVNLTFLEYSISTLYVETKPPVQKVVEANKRVVSSHRVHTIVKGDTLWALAAKFLGSGTKWQQIADLNNIRDPKLLRIGSVIRIP